MIENLTAGIAAVFIESIGLLLVKRKHVLALALITIFTIVFFFVI